MSSALLPDPLGFARINHQFSTEDVTFETGHGLLILGTATQDALDSLCAEISAAFVANLLHKLSTHCTLNNGQLIYSDGAGEQVGTSTVLLPGTAVGVNAPMSLALCCSIRTGDHYRGGHGRMYFGGLPQTAVSTDRAWDPGFVGDWETGFATYMAAVAALTSSEFTVVTPGVIHRFSEKTELDPHTFSPYTGTKTQKRICSQRRRLGRLF